MSGDGGMTLRMKVMILSAGEIYGGIERQIMDVCDWSDSDGRLDCHVHLFNKGKLSETLTRRGHSVHIIPSRSRYDLRTADELVRELESGEYDIVHAHGYKALVTLAVAALRGRTLPPVVKTVHGLPEPESQLPAGAMKSWLNSTLDRWATRLLRARVCYVTEDVRRHHEDNHAGLECTTVLNGIAPLDSSEYRRPVDLPVGGCVLAIVGRVAEVKGINYLITALTDPVMPLDVRFVVLGTGPSLGALRSQADRLGVSERILFLGFRENVYDYLAHVDGLMMPSLHEGLPYTLLEAMSLDIPVLASSVGGLAEILVDESTGLLFEARNPSAIAEACRRFVDEPDLVDRLRLNAAAVQREKYTMTTMMERYLEVYAKAVRTSSA